jgi:hypothetical protein
VEKAIVIGMKSNSSVKRGSPSTAAYLKRWVTTEAMMRTFIGLLVLGLTPWGIFAAEVLDFRFFDARGAEYRSTTLVTMPENPKVIERWPSLLVVYTPKLDAPEFKRQLSALREHGVFEELQLLVVVACPAVRDKDGYNMLTEEADRVALRPGQFSVRLLDGRGRLLKSSSQFLKVSEIRAVLEGKLSHNGTFEGDARKSGAHLSP